MFGISIDQLLAANMVQQSLINYFEVVDGAVENQIHTTLSKDNLESIFGIDQNYNIANVFALGGKSGTPIPTKNIFVNKFMQLNDIFFDNAYNKNIIDNPVRVEQNMTLPDCLSLAKGIHNFYGMLVVDTRTGTLFNPLHPLVAFQLIMYRNVFSLEKPLFQPIIFAYKSISRETMELLNLEPFSTPKPEYDDLSLFLMESFQNSLEVEIKDTQIINAESSISRTLQATSYPLLTYLNPLLELDSFYDSSSTKKIINLSKDIGQDSSIGVLVPNQLVTRGTPIPYYGISLISGYKSNSASSVRGSNLTPMLSHNISISESMYLNAPIDTKEYFKNILEEELALNNISLKSIRDDSLAYNGFAPRVASAVCTGDLLNTSLKGLRTLNHSNSSSAYTSHTLGNGWMTWAKYARTLSYKIYEEVGYVK